MDLQGLGKISTGMLWKKIKEYIANYKYTNAPLFSQSLETLEASGDTSKLYLLPDGFLYAYEKTLGSAFKNLYDKSQAVINKVRSGTNGSTLSAQNGVMSTGLIPITCSTDSSKPTIIRMRGVKMVNWKDSGDRVAYYDASGTHKWYCPIKGGKYTVHSNGDIEINAGWNGSSAIVGAETYRYFSISCHVKGTESAISESDIDNIIVTVDQEIPDGEKWQWMNTGVQYGTPK